MTNVDSFPTPATQDHRGGSGFWTVAYAFLIVMAFATLPSPLYGLYRIRDHLSALTVTVIYAIFAGGTIAALLSVRLITGVAVGLAAGTAITYLIELRARANPGASPIRARNIGTAVNVGALGVGPLIAGCLAEWVKHPLTLPYLLFVALGAIALIGLATAPETGAPAPPASADGQASSSSRSVRVLVPGAAATLAAFSANGLFAGLSGLFLATTLHHPSHALSGATLFLVFTSGVAAQLATTRLRPSRVL